MIEKLKFLLYRIKSEALRIFGDVKIFKWPLFAVYDPDAYGMDGDHIQRALKIAKPGDVFLRGYTHYADGYFIPGDYSHGALYVGDGKIIHAVAQGVSEIDAIDFMMCDRIAILRPDSNQEKAVTRAQKFLEDKIPYDYGFVRGVDALYCFELVAESYPEFEIQKKTASILGGLVKKKDPVYLAESMFECPRFKKVFEFNPRRGIDFAAE